MEQLMKVGEVVRHFRVGAASSSTGSLSSWLGNMLGKT
jgi:hypothetical protein